MDDDSVFEHQLDLMHALQNRTPLRQVDRTEIPSHIGGSKEQAPRLLSGLQAEFLSSSLAMQLRLRPNVERMEAIRCMTILNEERRALTSHIRKVAPISLVEEPKMLFQIEQVIAQRPGWMDLQQQVRDAHQKSLSPVECDGFYVVRNVHKCS